jgi:hypothetical protein
MSRTLIPTCAGLMLVGFVIATAARFTSDASSRPAPNPSDVPSSAELISDNHRWSFTSLDSLQLEMLQELNGVTMELRPGRILVSPLRMRGSSSGMGTTSRSRWDPADLGQA